MSARKRMRLEDGSSSVEELLEPSATMNDLPSEVMKNIFSFVGKGNYCFVAPVSKDFCYNYLTMDVIEDKFAHKMDLFLAMQKGKKTSAEAVSSSFELAEYCFLKAPENFQELVVKKAILKGRKDIVEMGHAIGIDINNMNIGLNVEIIAKRGDLEMIKLLHKKSSQVSEWAQYVIKAAAKFGQLGVLKWMKKNSLIEDRYSQRLLFLEAAGSGDLEVLKWAKDVAGFNFQEENESVLINDIAGSGNIELVKYMRSKGIPWNETTFCNAAYSDNISMFQYLLENECPHDDPRICSRSVEKGSNEKTFEKLQWLHEHNVPWDGKTCSIAARKGNLKALKYARSKGCPWHENCLRNAIVHRNFDVVEYCLQNRCPIGNSDICHYAMDDKDHDRALRMLRLLREFSVPWGERTCSKAASTGNFQALKRSVSQGCPWDRQECANYAAWHGDIEALKWIRSQGVVFDEISAMRAASNGHLETLKWLRSAGCPMGRGTFLHAAISGNFSVVEYCVDNDFSCGDRLYANAIENFDNPIPVIKLLQKNDYPWHPSACKAATILEDLKLLRWLRFNGCSWDEETCNAAVMNDNFDILKYAHENGCRWTKETYAYCFSYYGLDNEYSIIPTAAEIECLQAIFDYLIKHKCPKPDPGDWIIVE